MSVQGQLLDIKVAECRNLKDTEWISRQDPYVILDYAGNKHRTRTDTDGGRNPTFNEKHMLPLIEGLKEINVSVWNSNTLSADDFIGSGSILLHKVLAEGYHECTWPLTSRNGRRAGEIRISLRYSNPKASHASACQHHAPAHYTPQPYATPCTYPPSQQAQGGYPPAYSSYPSPGCSYYPPYGAAAQGPSMPHGSQAPYPPQAYPPQAYPPQSYPPPYPPQGYATPYPPPY